MSLEISTFLFVNYFTIFLMLKFLKSKEIYDENDNYVNTVDHLIIKDLTGKTISHKIGSLAP
ncbi:hypothetical protein HMPREF0509_00334 [Lactobacillus crispatus SJ-3C-US]|nr:hypothetical protein LBKG_02068 [Lactobacillus crispatus CTV-05]KFL94572.1 hypothetical protein HMPREF0509_00334 [Lactobacillus crispatus SJ-3C-US]